MEEVHVCYYSPRAYPLFARDASGSGGAEVQLYLSALQLSRDRRFRISFIVGDYGQKSHERFHGVDLYRLSSSPGRKSRSGTAELLSLWGLLRKIDAQVYIQRSAGGMTLASSVFCRLYGKKFVYMTAHDEDLESAVPAWFGKGLGGRAKWGAFRLGLRASHLVVVQHRGQQERLLRSIGKRGVIRRSGHPMPDRPPSYGRRSFVMWAARCEAWKQPEAFLALARGLPDRKFLMICPPSEDGAYFERIRREAASIPHVDFLGPVPHPEMESYYLQAKAFVNTSRKEGFPNTFVEAARAGTPVLSLSVDPDSILEEYGFGRCFRGDADRMARFLERALGDRALLEQMSGRAWAYAAAHHDAEKIAEEDKRLILSLLPPRP